MTERRRGNKHRALPALPYRKSILASFFLLLSMMLLFEFFTDPHTGELRSPGMMAPVFGVYVLVEAAIFYAEFRLRRKRSRAAFRTERKVVMRGACVD